RVIEAGSASEALSLADIPGLDWVISDLHLGPADGVDLLAELGRRNPRLRLALMTSLPQDQPRRKAGAHRWPVLSKPVEAAALAQLLSEAAAA
ncbi:MAG: response regulator, partial [Roseicyclus sp.]